jgi:hypothetical protein
MCKSKTSSAATGCLIQHQSPQQPHQHQRSGHCPLTPLAGGAYSSCGTPHYRTTVLLNRSQLSAGETALAELVLDQPLWLANHDRLILRDASARDTIAGARLLELQVPGRGKRQPARLAYLQHLQTTSLTPTERLQQQSQQQAVVLEDFAWAMQLHEHALQQLLAQSPGQQVAGRFITRNTGPLCRQPCYRNWPCCTSNSQTNWEPAVAACVGSPCPANPKPRSTCYWNNCCNKAS